MNEYERMTESILELIETHDADHSEEWLELMVETMLVRVMALAYVFDSDPLKVASFVYESIRESEVEVKNLGKLQGKSIQWKAYRSQLANMLAERQGSNG